jgi:acetyl esterase/lipase
MRIVTIAAAVFAAAGTLAAQVLPAPAAARPQMPPDIAAQLRQIGPVVDPPATARIYRPLHPRPPYPDVTVTRDLSYGPDARQTMDIFVEAAAPPGPILMPPTAPPVGVAPPAPGAPAPAPAVTTAPAPTVTGPVPPVTTPPAGAAVRGGGRPVLVYVSGGAGNKIEPVAGGDAFYDNIMLWAVKNGMTGINVQRLATPGRSATDAARDIGLVIDWVQKNIARYGGNPARVFIWAHSAGNAAVARYLADPETHPATGHGVKGAVLMGATAAIVPPALSAGLAKSGVRLFVAAGELDLPAAVSFVDAVKNEPCQGAACPATAIFSNHSHMSAVLAPNTADDSVTAPLLQWMTALP